MTAQEKYKLYFGGGPDQSPFGLSMKEWIKKWWKWLLEIPEADNPSNDSTGEKCSVGQSDPHVWFLAGAHTHKPYHTMATAKRRCDVPGDKAIGVAIAANELSAAEFPFLSHNQMTDYASEGDQLDFVELLIDGVPIKGLLESGITSDFFKVIMPENNIFGVPPGETEVVGHGYMVILEGLSEGNHDLSFTQFTREHIASRTPSFGYKVIYQLNILPFAKS
jgi:hypothetical protein